MAESGPYTMLLPWYATLFRSKQFAAALLEIAPVALRYGATSYHVYQSHDDLYWYGPEFSRWRAEHAGWYQVPVVYAPAHEIASGALEHESVELDV